MAAEEQDLQEIWHAAVASLTDENRLSSQQMAFIRLSKLIGTLGDTALIAVPNELTKDFLEQRLRVPLNEALTKSCNTDMRFAVTVDSHMEVLREDPEAVLDLPEEKASAPAPAADNPEAVLDELEKRPAAVPQYRSAEAPYAARQSDVKEYSRVNFDAEQRGFNDNRYQDAPRNESGYVRPSEAPPAELQGTVENTRLNPKYTFDTFVIGASNRFAHAAAVAVAEAPAKAYNPLFIYGDSGLGKTHLLHAVGHYARSLYQGVRVRYVNSEEFTNDFINSIRDDKAGAFQARYREVDVLLIDDIQFLQRAERTMEEFFHTFNTLHNANKQIVITSDLPPKQLSGFEERMRSRFEWGLLTDVQPPDLETRIAILRKKVSNESLHVPGDVLEYIASRISTNIRELEGALIRVTAYGNLSRQAMDISLAEFVLKDLITDEGDSEITVNGIMAHTAEYFGLSVDDLMGSNRTRVLVTARQIAMYLCREMTDLSLIRIGQAFGGRDHTTVIHANKKISDLMNERRAIFNQVTELTARIKNGSKN